MAVSSKESVLTRCFAERAGETDAKLAMGRLIAKFRRSVRAKSAEDLLLRLQSRRNVTEVRDEPNLSCDGCLEPLGNSFSDGFRIVLNSKSPKGRRTFTFAHELCHTYFYELVPEIKYCPHKTDDAEERICNFGAQELLMPAKTVSQKSAGLPICLSSLQALANDFGVSMDSMLLRLKSLNRWPVELSSWVPLTNGRIAIERLVGGARLDWRWTNESFIARAWRTGTPITGSTIIEAVDMRGVHYSREVSFEIQRRRASLLVLWGNGVRPKSELPPLFARKQPTAVEDGDAKRGQRQRTLNAHSGR